MQLIKMTRTIDYGVSDDVKRPTYLEYTVGSGTYNSPIGCSYIIVEAVGGGGGGAKNSATLTSGGSGGGGGYFKKQYVPGSYNYSVGSAGLGYSTNGTNGQSGTATVFGSDSAGGGMRGQLTISGTGGSVTATNAISIVKGGDGRTINMSGWTCAGGSSFMATPQQSIDRAEATTARINGFRGSGGAGVGDSVTKAGNGGSGVLLITEYY